MPLEPNKEVFITCAVTGSGSSQDRSHYVPRSPVEIATSAIEAAKAGAAVVHCHVRDPETGKPSRNLDYYREATELIRASSTDVILNLTAGMGGDLVLGGTDAPLPPVTGTDMISAKARIAHIELCLPELCTLDCGTMNFAEADYVMTNTPGMLREMGAMMTALGVTPEIEAFDTGHLWFAKQLVNEGILNSPGLVQLCMGIPWGAPDDFRLTGISNKTSINLSELGAICAARHLPGADLFFSVFRFHNIFPKFSGIKFPKFLWKKKVHFTWIDQNFKKYCFENRKVIQKYTKNTLF